MRKLPLPPRLMKLEGGKITAPPASSVTPQQLANLTFAFGPSAAGWLVWAHRGAMRRTGAVDFELPDRKPLPLWFAVAMEFLKKRTRKWRVEVHRRASGGAKYRVIWRGKHGNVG